MHVRVLLGLRCSGLCRRWAPYVERLRAGGWFAADLLEKFVAAFDE